MKKNKKKIIVGATTLLILGASLGCLWMPASMFFAEGTPDPCLLKTEEVELSDFISQGLLEGENKTSKKTTGTITRILKNEDNSQSFYMERLHPVTRERSAIKVVDYEGDTLLSVGDYVSIEGS